MPEPRHVRPELRNAAFPVVVRGYDRRAVDAYVTRANRVIAELEATRSPQSAVKRALDRTQEERESILEQARAMAWEITGTARRKAEAITAQARAEAADIVVNSGAEAERTQTEADKDAAKTRSEAEKTLANSRALAADRLRRAQEEIAALREEARAQMREVQADTEAIWGERRDLLDDLREIATRLHKAASPRALRAPAAVPLSGQKAIGSIVRQGH